MELSYIEYGTDRMSIVANDPQYESQAKQLVESGLLGYTHSLAQRKYTLEFTPFIKILGPGLYTLFLLRNGQVVGVVSINTQENTPSIVNFSLSITLRGKGIGRALLEYALQIIKESGYSKVNLITTANLHDAITLYKKLGFVVEGEGKKYVDIGMQKIYMYKNL